MARHWPGARPRSRRCGRRRTGPASRRRPRTARSVTFRSRTRWTLTIGDAPSRSRSASLVEGPERRRATRSGVATITASTASLRSPAHEREAVPPPDRSMRAHRARRARSRRPRHSSAVAVAAPWSSARGTLDQPMSPASRAVEEARPGRPSSRARARPPRPATLSVGRAIRFQRRSIGPFALAVARRASPRRRRRRATGRPGRAGRSARAGRPRRDPFAEGQVAVARRGQPARCNGRGQPRARDRGARAVWGEHGHVESRLQEDLVAGADAVDEAPVGGAATQEDVLAVVEREPVAPDRGREAAEHGPALEEHDLGPAVRGGERGRDARPGRPRPRRCGAGSSVAPRPGCDRRRGPSPRPAARPGPSSRPSARARCARAGAGRSRPWRRRRPGCGRRAGRAAAGPRRTTPRRAGTRGRRAGRSPPGGR